MIRTADITTQPNSGDFEERIYDHESPWNSQSWTWIKFTNDDGHVWVGHFRGQPRSVAVSNELRETIVLTSDYVFRLDNVSADIIEFEDQPQYHNLTVAPDGSFILADYYKIERLKNSFKDIESLSSPVEMDLIRFIGWTDGKLHFTCDEFANWERHLEMTLDSNDWKIRIMQNVT